ncbi:hypothetical protein HYY69_00180 [Candidatus Woesearchaeota archaeon]|nr:hypothetical protein [Candidatus Woesearchaeota archaeon]
MKQKQLNKPKLEDKYLRGLGYFSMVYWGIGMLITLVLIPVSIIAKLDFTSQLMTIGAFLLFTIGGISSFYLFQNKKWAIFSLIVVTFVNLILKVNDFHSAENTFEERVYGIGAKLAGFYFLLLLVGLWRFSNPELIKRNEQKKQGLWIKITCGGIFLLLMSLLISSYLYESEGGHNKFAMVMSLLILPVMVAYYLLFKNESKNEYSFKLFAYIGILGVANIVVSLMSGDEPEGIVFISIPLILIYSGIIYGIKQLIIRLKGESHE